MTAQPPHTAEEATASELRRASFRLLLMLLALVLLVVPLIRDLPLGRSTRIGMLAWLLVVLALYWLFQGMGYRPLLLLQLAIFSIAATMLSAKLLLVIVDVNQVNFLRTMARRLIVVGAFCAGINLLGMLMTLAQRRRPG
jgi:flagellar biogenesis protein FliO